MEQQRAQDRDRTWAEWLRAANAGDEIAYRRLLEALAPFLRAVVRLGFTRSGFGNCDVEDVVQETLLAIHLKRQTWDEDEAGTRSLLWAIRAFAISTTRVGHLLPGFHDRPFLHE
jgi:DNA-directed RNA polymerase specialized sigma24 family protein